MNRPSPSWDCIVVGAGISGLAARYAMVAAGRRVMVLEKSRGLGGRTATRRLEPAGLADLGAQFFSSRNPKFMSLLQDAPLKEIRLAQDALHPRFIHPAGMSRVAHHLAEGHAESPDAPIVRGARVAGILPGLSSSGAAEVQVQTEAGETFAAASLLLTQPAPQSVELLRQSGILPVTTEQKAIADCCYHPCLAAVFTVQPGFNAPGILKEPGGDLSGLFDQAAKGLATPVPLLVAHMNPAFSEEHWSHPEAKVLRAIWERVLPHCKSAAPTTASSLHRWKYCEPVQAVQMPYLRWDGSLPVWLAGDAFMASRMEGAFNSGDAAAQSILSFLNERIPAPGDVPPC